MSSIAIGQFSRMTRLTVKALRLYDREGLLVPAVVDPATRYRYYSKDQLKAAEMIRVMRSLDMPLRKIKDVLALEDKRAVAAELAHHQARVVEQIAARERMTRYLEVLVREQSLVVDYSIELIEQAPIRVASVRRETRLSRIGGDIRAGFAELVGELSSLRAAPSGPPSVIYHDIIDEDVPGEIEMCVPIAARCTFTDRDLEGGLFASLHCCTSGPTRRWVPPTRPCRAMWRKEITILPAAQRNVSERPADDARS